MISEEQRREIAGSGREDARAVRISDVYTRDTPEWDAYATAWKEESAVMAQERAAQVEAVAPSVLYAREPIRVERNLWRVQSVVGDEFMEPDWDQNERVELRVLADFSFDGERTWFLVTVWLDGNPFMVIQMAGRGDRDHQERFVTDHDRYSAAVQYMRSLIPVGSYHHDSVHPVDEPIRGLTEFYGNRLDQILAEAARREEGPTGTG
jgi:hypothetical protein